MDRRRGGVWDVLYRVFRLLSGIEWWGGDSDWVQGEVGWGWVCRAGGRSGWSGRGSAAGRVEYFGHLVVVGTVGAVAEGCMGVFVFEGFSLALAALAGIPFGGGRSGEQGVVSVEVPSRRGELVLRR